MSKIYDDGERYEVKLTLEQWFSPENSKLVRTGTIDYVYGILPYDEAGYSQELEEYAIDEMEIDKSDFKGNPDCLVVFASYYDRKGKPVDNCHARIYMDTDGNIIGETEYYKHAL